VTLTGIDHVQLAAPAGCEAEARRFYGDVLGLEEIEKPEPLRGRGGIWFRIGAQQLHIGVDESFTAARKAHPALISDDIDLLAAHLEEAGAPVTWDKALPVRRFYTEDPWGNRLEVTG
jgi:catechol 2,3-dioxygenase-like lactoylglutathione lyase family enzyme